MQKLRTYGTLLMFFFGAILIFIAAPSVETYKIDDSVNNLEKAFHIVQISDITTRANDDDIKSLITYQSINHSNATSDEDWRLFKIDLDDIQRRDDDVLLISTPNDLCRENSTLPAWKIDKSVGSFLVKINHAKQFEGKTLYLCYYDEATGQFQHFGHESRFTIPVG